jgi:membrane protein
MPVSCHDPTWPVAAMTTIDAGLDEERGRDADSPADIGWEGWKDILWRVWAEFNQDRITLIAAGATFYLLLALFPALAAFVSIYGFVADPVTIADHIAFLAGFLPSGGVDLIKGQLQSLASQNEAALSVGFVFGLLVALWSANNGIKTLFEAMNVAYDETEKRSFVRLNLISLGFTLGSIVIGILFLVSVGVVPAVLAFVGLGSVTETLIALLRWPVLFIAAAFALSVLYRYGPSRARANWRWVTWGSVIATALWLLASILFSWYLSHFADYNATYGSLGAVIGFMMWTWISVVIVLLGAELNSEMEHQTRRDSTTGRELPMGMRGATMADTLGKSRHSPAAQLAAARAGREPARFSSGPDQPADFRRRAAALRVQRSPQAGVVFAFAVPIAAVGLRLLLDRWDRSPPRTELGRGGARSAVHDRREALLAASSRLLSRLHVVAIAPQARQSMLAAMRWLNAYRS